jgi:hypothetical protein
MVLSARSWRCARPASTRCAHCAGSHRRRSFSTFRRSRQMVGRSSRRRIHRYQHIQIVSIPLDGSDPVALVEGKAPAQTLDGREVLYSVQGRVMAIPLHGGTQRAVTEVDGTVMSTRAGADGKVHMMVARPQGFEAWGAPVAGGSAERELPDWAALWPAPRGGGRAVLQISTEAGGHVSSRRAPRSRTPPRERSRSRPRESGHPTGCRSSTRKVQPCAASTSSSNFAVSPDGKTLYTVHNVGARVARSSRTSPIARGCEVLSARRGFSLSRHRTAAGHPPMACP